MAPRPGMKQDTMADRPAEGVLVEITASNQRIPPRRLLVDVGDAAYNLGNSGRLDWERFYETLETYGYDMQDLGGSVDNRIQRIVRAAVREGEIS